METSTLALAVTGLLILIALGFFFYFVPVGLWITAIFSGVGRAGTLIGMRLRKVNPADIVRPYISASKAGLDLDIGQMEAHYLAGGNVGRVVTALISADRANIDLPWQRATAIDLAGRDVLEAVQVSVNPKVIQTPRVTAVAKDGIQVIAVARVTVRANIDRLVGGAGEETIIARVGEGTVSSIGSADSTSRCWRTSTRSPVWCSTAVLTPAPPTRSSRSTSPTSTSDATSAPSCRPTRPRRTSGSPRPRRKNAARWRSPRSRRCGRGRRGRSPGAPRPGRRVRSGRLGVMDHYRMQNIQADTTMRASLASNEG